MLDANASCCDVRFQTVISIASGDLIFHEQDCDLVEASLRQAAAQRRGALPGRLAIGASGALGKGP